MGKNRVCYFYDGASTLPGPACAPLSCSAAFTPCLACSGQRPPRRSTGARASRADEVAGLYYGLRHPMKPQRITMTHHLVLGYRLHDSMDVYVRRSPPVRCDAHASDASAGPLLPKPTAGCLCHRLARGCTSLLELVLGRLQEPRKLRTEELTAFHTKARHCAHASVCSYAAPARPMRVPPPACGAQRAAVCVSAC